MECERCQELLKRIGDLEKKLAKYENAHTPPSLGGGFRRKLIAKEDYKKHGSDKFHCIFFHEFYPSIKNFLL